MEGLGTSGRRGVRATRSRARKSRSRTVTPFVLGDSSICVAAQLVESARVSAAPTRSCELAPHLRGDRANHQQTALRGVWVTPSLLLRLHLSADDNVPHNPELVFRTGDRRPIRHAFKVTEDSANLYKVRKALVRPLFFAEFNHEFGGRECRVRA